MPLLLKLGENKKALLSAIYSGDTDLVYMVILQLKETTQLADFQVYTNENCVKISSILYFFNYFR